MVVKDIHVKAETDSVLFKCDVFKVVVGFVAAKETTAQMDRKHIVLFVDKDQVFLFCDVEPTCFFFVVVERN